MAMQGSVREIALEVVCADGRRLPVLLHAAARFSADGAREVHRIVLTAGTDRREYERELLRARRSAEHAGAASERARERLTLLADTTTAMLTSLDVAGALARLAEAVVPALADYAFAYLTGDAQADEGPLTASAHVDPRRRPLLSRLVERMPSTLTAAAPLSTVLAGGPPQLIAKVPPAILDTLSDDPQVRSQLALLGAGSALIVPLVARGRPVAVLVLVRTGHGKPYTEEDLADAMELAGRAALAVDNARLYSREHRTALALQQSLLSPLPEIPGLTLCARYLPGSRTAAVGGDWYDVLALPDGSIGLAIGDVMGHDVTAAAAMGQLRSVLRSYAWEGGSPAAVLDRLDRLVQGLGMAQLATCFYGCLSGGSAARRLTMANAGHHPPLLRLPGGEVRSVDSGAGMLIGVEVGVTRRVEAQVDLPPGSLLLLYTDGLVEARHHSLDEGVAAVSRILAAHRPEHGVEALCDALTRRVGDRGQDDDVALLAVQLP
jgi:serine phosphatase RsbU (regulator of sigma subunit)